MRISPTERIRTRHPVEVEVVAYPKDGLANVVFCLGLINQTLSGGFIRLRYTWSFYSSIIFIIVCDVGRYGIRRIQILWWKCEYLNNNYKLARRFEEMGHICGILRERNGYKFKIVAFPDNKVNFTYTRPGKVQGKGIIYL